MRSYGVAGMVLVLLSAAVAEGQKIPTLSLQKAERQGWGNQGIALIPGPDRKPKVTVAPVERVTVSAGKAATVEISFRVAPGYHINSNQPKSELLVPTSLSLTPPTNILLGKVTYPPGKEASFPFAPEEKLNVYSGDFSVQALVRTARSTPAGAYRVRGQLRYQACDDRACYPPAEVPLQFEVSVKKAAELSH